jgi:hypothetical protein
VFALDVLALHIYFHKSIILPSGIPSEFDDKVFDSLRLMLFVLAFVFAPSFQGFQLSSMTDSSLAKVFLQSVQLLSRLMFLQSSTGLLVHSGLVLKFSLL